MSLQPANGQHTSHQVKGSWLGTLDVGGAQLRLVFNLTLVDDGPLKATLDSPDQGAKDVPLGEVSLYGDSIRIDAPSIMGFYIGTIESDSTIDGEWHQNGAMFKLDIKKQEKAFVLNRPQEPLPPYPYIEEEVSFQNTEQGISLGGTLTIPDGVGPFPAALLVTGSGSQNRDEEIFGHKPFKVIADYLTRNGMAVLRYDDRGVGASGGNPVGGTTLDFSWDAWAAIEFLLNRDEIDPGKIGIIGHSEGGIIAFMLASSHDEIAYVISLAGPGVDGKTILLDQSEHIARLSGVDPSIVEDNRTIMSNVYDKMEDDESYQQWEKDMNGFVGKFYSEKENSHYSEEDIEKAEQNLLRSIPESSYNWLRYFMMFDPAILFPGIHCPVLALNGQKDCQVLPEKNTSAIYEGLISAGNTKVDTMILSGLNHLFQNCQSGLPSEYGIIEETFDQKTLDLMDEWIQDQLISGSTATE